MSRGTKNDSMGVRALLLLGSDEDEAPDYDEDEDGDEWEGFRRFPDGSVLDSEGYDTDGNQREYW